MKQMKNEILIQLTLIEVAYCLNWIGNINSIMVNPRLDIVSELNLIIIFIMKK